MIEFTTVLLYGWAFPTAVTFAWMAAIAKINGENFATWREHEVSALWVLGAIWPLGLLMCIGLTLELIAKRRKGGR